MLGVISDIHGNYPALKAVLQRLDEVGCEQLISLGDVCGYYCMVNECMQELRERNVLNIMGNHDLYMICGRKCERSDTANMCLAYQRRILTKENLIWLKQSVPYIREKEMWLVHGGWHDYVDEYVTNFTFLNQKVADIRLYMSGHTHVQKKIKGEYAVYVNPGSVGQPRDGISTAAYAVIEETGVVCQRIEYDIDHIVYEMKQAGFPDRISSCLYHGVRIGEDGK